MSKKKQFTVTAPEEPEIDEQQGDEQEPVEVMDDSVQKIFELLKSLDISGGKCRIYLKRQNQLRPGYIGEMSVETFQQDGLESLKRTYGGGDYTFQFVDSTGQYLKQASLTIDPRFKGELDEKPAAEKPDAEDRIEKLVEKLKPAPPSDNMMPLMITLITESQKTMVALMSENQKSTNTILTGLMAAITQSAQKPATDPLLLEMVRQKTDKTPLLETIEAMTALRSLNDDGSPKEDMVEKFVKLVGPSLMAMLTRQAPGMPQMPMAPPPPPALEQLPEQTRVVAAAPGPVSQVQSPKSTEPKLVTFIPMLLNAARKGTEPAAYYEVICDNITVEQLDELITELERDTWFETLFGSHPEVTAQRAWLEKLRTVFLAVEGDEKDEQDEKTG